MTKEDFKFKIAKIIAGGTCYSEQADYQELIEAIYENRYRAIDKCPIDLYILGTVETFVIRDLDQANRILNVVKEVTQEILETSGIELTSIDEDWNNLKFINNPEYRWSNHPYILSKLNKSYMSEFFED